MYACFLNCDDDAVYYRYTGTYSSWSAPVLFAVMQVPPYRRVCPQMLMQWFGVLRAVSAQDQPFRPQFSRAMYFDLLDGGNLRIVDKEVLDEKAVFISAPLTF